jgi:hypothetical protein
MRDLIAKKMTPAQIAEAQRLASVWKPKPKPNFPGAGAQTLPWPNSPPQGVPFAPPAKTLSVLGVPITSKRREGTSHGQASFVTRDLLSSMPRMKIAGLVSLNEVILKVREVAIEKLIGDAEGGNAEAQNELGYGSSTAYRHLRRIEQWIRQFSTTHFRSPRIAQRVPCPRPSRFCRPRIPMHAFPIYAT